MELGLLLRREPAEDDGLEAGVGVLGDRLQTRLDHDIQRTVAAKDAGREDAEAHAHASQSRSRAHTHGRSRRPRDLALAIGRQALCRTRCAAVGIQQALNALLKQPFKELVGIL